MKKCYGQTKSVIDGQRDNWLVFYKNQGRKKIRMEMITLLRSLNMVSIIFRITLAIFVGGIIGMERGRKHRPAGLRTYILVCLGAALVMMTNQFVYDEFNASDPVRLGAQVISGIGFLGAGTIVLTGKSQVKGLTTAASLWAAACIGLAIGIGFYEGAVVGGLAIMFTVSGLHSFDNWMNKKSNYLELYVEYQEEENTFSDFLKYARDNYFDVSNLQMSGKGIHGNENGKRIVSYILTAKSTVKRPHEEMIRLLMRADGVVYIEEF